MKAIGVFFLAVGMICLLQSGASADFSPGPLAIYSFDDDGNFGQNLGLDDTGNGNNGTVVGGTAQAPGVSNGAASFDGDDDYIDMGDNPSLEPGAGEDFTVSAWFKTTGDFSEAYGMIASDYASGSTGAPCGGFQLHVVKTTGAVRFSIRDHDPLDCSDPATFHSITTDVGFADDSWHLAIGIRSGTAMKLYVDGNLWEGTCDGGPMNNNTPFLVGRFSEYVDAGYNHDFKGQIDEVRVFGRALGEAEIEQLAHYSFDDSDALGHDDTGNGNNGEVLGDPIGIPGGVSNGAVSFDGSDGYIDVGDIDALEPGAGEDFTVSAWFKTAGDFSEAYGMIASDYASGSTGAPCGGFQLHVIKAGGAVRFSLRDHDSLDCDPASFNSVTTDTSFADGSWHLAVGIRAGTAMKLYVDGELWAGTCYGGPMDNDNPFLVGRFSEWATAGYDFDFKGGIDEVRLIHRALSEAEITDLYCSDAGGDADGDGVLAAECGGTDCNDTNPNVYPGHAEVCGNGIDDNCNGTADENWPCSATAVASTIHGSDSVKDSGVVNFLGLLLIPMGAVAVLRTVRRKK